MKTKTLETITYLMRHGYKLLEGADSVKADMKAGDINGIQIDKTMNALERGILSDLNGNPLTEIATSGRLRGDSTGELLKSMYEETHDNTVKLSKDYRFSDIVLLSEDDAGDNPYFNNSTIDSYSDGSASWFLKSFFDDKIAKWAISKAKEGVNEWERLKMFFMSDPNLKGKKPISEDTFGASMPAYEIGERGFSSLYSLVCTSASSMGNNDENDNEKPGNIAVISHSAIIEPIVAYAILDRETCSSESREIPRREMFYEILHDFITDKVGDKQWGFTEYIKIGWENVPEMKLNKWKNKMEKGIETKVSSISGFRGYNL